MNVITRIEIRNFQSHAYTIIEPTGAGQLTVITGATDSGKSGVFRALRWLYYGGPCYPRIGCTHTAVSVTFADGTLVTRERSGKTNRYIIERPGEEPQVFESFGRDVPAEVQQALGVRVIQAADVTLEANLARQHDPAFLVAGLSAPARARILGHIAGIEAVDLAAKSATADMVNGRQEANRLDREIAELEAQVRQYDYLPALGKRIERLVALQAAITQAEQRKDKLSILKTRLIDIDGRGVIWTGVYVSTAGAAQALQVIDKAQTAVARRRSLLSLRNRLLGLADEARSWGEAHRNTAGAERAMSLVEAAQAAASRRQALQSLRTRLHGLAAEDAATRRQLVKTAGAANAAARVAQAEAASSRLTRLRYIKNLLAGLAEGERLLVTRVEATKQATGAVEPIRVAEELVAKRQRLTELSSKLTDLRQQEQRARGAMELAATDVTRAQELYASALREAGRCPVCGSPTHEEHIKEVV